MSATPIPKATRARILADYQTGMTQVDVARKHGVAPASVFRIVTAAGVRRPPSPPTPSASIEAAIKDYVESAERTSVVASRHNISADTLQKHLRERGLNRPSASQSSGIRDAAVRDYAAGGSSMEVAKKHGVSASTVVAWSRAAGVEIRSPGAPGDDEPLAHEGQWVRRGLVMVSTASRSAERRNALLRALLEERDAAAAVGGPDDELTCARRRRDMAADFDALERRERTAT